MDWIGKDWIGKDWIGKDWIRKDWIGKDWIRKDWIGKVIASAMQPWQIYLGARTIHILHQDVAVMLVSIFSIKLEQLQKRLPKELKKGSPDADDEIWDEESSLHLLRGRFIQ